MVAKTLKTEEEIKDFVRGCAFFGTGGGGAPEDGLKQLLDVYREGYAISWCDMAEVPDEATTICAYGMGSIAPQTQEDFEEMKFLGLSEEAVKDKLVAALKETEEYTGKKVGVIAPLEIGGANTPTPVAAAARMGIKVVDGDYSGGRAIPEITQTTPHLNGKSMLPLVSVDQWGNTCIIKKAVNNWVAEKLGKLISVLAYGKLAGNATYLFSAAEMKRLIIQGTLSKAFETGKLIRMAREKGEDPVEAIKKSTSGWLLFKGKVSKKEPEECEEYYQGAHTIAGTGEFTGHEFNIWFKNENHISWLDGKPYVASPDLICVVDLKTGEPITNPAMDVGNEVAVLGVRADEAFRSEAAIKELGPKHFGFKDIPYVPIEKILG
jgi:hypothetical protein